MPAASYKKDMVGRTRISDRLDIGYLFIWNQIFGYSTQIQLWGIMFCGPHFEHISVDFSNVVLQVCSIILRIQTYYSKQYNTSENQDLGCLPDPSLTTSMILKWGSRREVKWLIFIWPDDVCVCVHMIFYAFYASRPFQRTYELPIGQFKRDEWKWNCAFYDTP